MILVIVGAITIFAFMMKAQKNKEKKADKQFKNMMKSRGNSIEVEPYQIDIPPRNLETEKLDVPNFAKDFAFIKPVIKKNKPKKKKSVSKRYVKNKKVSRKKKK